MNSSIDQTLQALINNSTATVANRLVALNRICQEQHERGSADFSVATIGRIAENQGVIKSQSIRNKTGEKYQTLIKAWSDIFFGKETSKKSSSCDWIDKINDPQIKWLVRDQLTELSSLRREINALKSMSRQIYIGSSNAKDENLKDDSASVSTALNKAEVDALMSGVDEERLMRLGLEIGSLGEIKNTKGINVMPFGFVSAIKKITALERK